MGPPIPVDVVNLGNTSGMMGVNHWPTYSSRVVGDMLDNLPDKYKDDFERVRKNIYLHLSVLLPS